MNCREFKNQFEDGLSLNMQAENHLENCVECRSFHSENLQLSQMFQTLPKVEAPKDFEFGFRSKLANAELRKPLSPIWQTLRYLLPAAAVLILGFVIVNSNLFSTENNQQVAGNNEVIEKSDVTAEEKVSQTQTLVKEESNTATALENTDEEPSEDLAKSETNRILKNNLPVVAGNTQKQKNSKKADNQKIFIKDFQPELNMSGILVRDNAVTQSEQINPLGINPDKKIYDPQVNIEKKTFTADEILLSLGIKTTNENDNLRVNSVVKNSVGETSGVINDDLITAIDDQKVSDKQSTKGFVQGKTLKIQRGENQMIIAIKSN